MDTAHDFRTIYCSRCGSNHQVPVRCRDRFCPICSKVAAGRTRARLQWLIGKVPKRKTHKWTLITLTLASSDDLSSQIDHLVKSFRKLRSRHVWTDNVTGGLYVIEVTSSKAGWHAHLHIICQCRYIPQHQLSRVWQTVSGSRIVDIRRCRPDQVAGYVTHYLTKFDIPGQGLQEARTAMRGRRLWSPFGDLHDLNLQYVRPPFYCTQCGACEWTILEFARVVERGAFG